MPRAHLRGELRVHIDIQLQTMELELRSGAVRWRDLLEVPPIIIGDRYLFRPPAFEPST